MCASASDRDGPKGLAGARGSGVGGRPRGTRATLAGGARALASAVGVAAVITGCTGLPPGVSRMTVFNTNAGPVTIEVASLRGYAAFSIAACATAEFTFDAGWKAASGAEPAPAGGASIVIDASEGPESSRIFYEVITGKGYREYVGTPPESLPACSAPSEPARPSG